MSVIHRYKEAKAKYSLPLLRAVLDDPQVHRAMSPGYIGSGDFSFAGSAAAALASLCNSPPEYLQKIRKGEKLSAEDTAKFAEPVFDWFAAKTDPTATRTQRPWKFAAWTVEAYCGAAKEGRRILIEDIYKIRDDLGDFEAFQQQLSAAERDISKYKSYKQLEETLRPHQQRRDAKHAEAARKRMDQETLQRIMTQTSKIYDGPEGKIVVPHTMEACIYWGQQTKWCISAEKANNFFRSYNEKEPIWIYLPKVSAEERKLFSSFTSFKFAGTQGTLFNENDGQERSLIPSLEKLIKATLANTPKQMRRHLLNYGCFKKLPSIVPTPRFWQNSKKVMLDAIKKNPHAASLILTKELSENHNFMLWVTHENNHLLKLASLKLLTDRKFALDAWKQGGSETLLSESLPYRSDKEFLLDALKLKSHIREEDFLQQIDPELADNREFANEMVKAHPMLYFKLKPEFKDREMRLLFLDGFKDGNTWFPGRRDEEQAEFYADREILLKTATKFAIHLYRTPHELWKDDRELQLAAIRSNYSNMEHLPASARKDKEIVLTYLKACGTSSYNLLSFNELEGDKDVALGVVKVSGMTLERLPAEMKADRDVVLTAVTQYGNALQFASDKLKRDFTIVAAAVEKNAEALQYAPESMTSNADIVLRAVEKNAAALQYASHDLRANRAFVIAAEAVNKGAANQATLELRLDRGLKFRAKLKRAWHKATGMPIIKADAQLCLPPP